MFLENLPPHLLNVYMIFGWKIRLMFDCFCFIAANLIVIERIVRDPNYQSNKPNTKTKKMTLQ